MTTFAFTSDASSIYRETSGVLVAREGGAAAPAGFLGFDHTCTDAHHDDHLPVPAGTVVVTEMLAPAFLR